MTTVEQSNKTRACLFNLILFTREERRIDYYNDIIHSIVDKFPCRILFIQEDTKSEMKELETKFSTVSAGGQQSEIVCDRLDIIAPTPTLERVPFYVLPYLLPDMPLYLLWGEDPTLDKTVLPHLQKFASRLIFDSECTQDLQIFSCHLLQKLKSFRCDLIDLNWARFAGWRNVLSQLFSKPGNLEHLKRTSHIKLIYNKRTTSSFQRCETQADYLQAWLSTRMGWQFQEVKRDLDNIYFSYQHHHLPIEIDVIPEEYEIFNPGKIVSLELTTRDHHIFSLHCHPSNPRYVEIKSSTDDSCNIPYFLPLPSQAPGANLIKELLYSQPSSHYIDMLRLISKEKI